MDLSTLIQQYGIAMVFAGTLFEGETTLVLGGYAAHQGYLALPAVMSAAFAGAWIADVICYFLGRYWGDQLLARAPHWHARADRMRRLLHRHHVTVILSLRFLYGLRTVGTMAVGMSGIPPSRFVPLALVSAAAWSIGIGLVGYLVGSMVTQVAKDIAVYGAWVAAGGLTLGFTTWLTRRGFAAVRSGNDRRR